MKTLHVGIIIAMTLLLVILIQPVQAQGLSSDENPKNSTLLIDFSLPMFNGCCESLAFNHNDSMFAYAPSLRDHKSGSWTSSLWLYYSKNNSSRHLDLNNDLNAIFDLSFSPDDKKLLFVGSSCDKRQSTTTFYVFNPSDINLKCNAISNVRSVDWMPDGSVIVLRNNEKNDTLSIYQNGTEKLLYTKPIVTSSHLDINSSHIVSIKASPDGQKIALWYFVGMSHKTQILNLADGKIIRTFDGGHPRWGQDSNTLLYTLPTNPGFLSNGARAVITYIDLLDIDNNKTSTIYSIPLGITDLSLSHDGKKVFYVVNVNTAYDFMNVKSGMYEIDLTTNYNNTQSAPLLPPVTTLQSPLKQFKSGIKAENVQCKEGLQLIFKIVDNSPACVKQQTAQRLVERGYAKETTSITNPTSNVKSMAQNYTNISSDIIPGHMRRGTCGGPAPAIQSSSKIINATGFVGVYHDAMQYYANPDDYVLEPGHTGTIMYKIDAGPTPKLVPFSPIKVPKNFNVTNYAIFYHEITSLEELAKHPGVTIHDHYDYNVCFTRPTGEPTCSGEIFGGKNSIEAYVTDHVGVNATFDPTFEALQFNDTHSGHSSQIIRMTISSDANTTRGTYMVILSPEECRGGEIFLLTIGEQPYHE